MSSFDSPLVVPPLIVQGGLLKAAAAVNSNQKLDTGRTWLVLINGGEKSYEEEKVARDELKKIYKCFVSRKLVKPEHVICASGGKEKLFQLATMTNVSRISSVVPQSTTSKATVVQDSDDEGVTVDLSSAFFNLAPSLPSVNKIELTANDSVIVVFIGHGSEPITASQMPPSSEKDTGRLVFYNREPGINLRQLHGCASTSIGGKQYDDLSNFKLAAGKTLFICQACYAGNTISKMAKRTNDPTQNKHILAISTGPDHPASYDPILAGAISDFFSSDWKEKTLGDFHQHIQDGYYGFSYCKQMMKENMDQTEECYEEERLETVEWATKEFEMFQPRKIPQELWKMFQAVEKLKLSVDQSDTNREQVLAHVKEMEQYRFDLMRMYKHKPNYKMHMYGSVDVLGKTKMADFLHLN